jgi:hypothetical protein
MPSGGTYRLEANWKAGDRGQRRFTIGPDAATRNEVANSLCLLRVGYSGAALQESVDCQLFPADPGTEIGPVDVPLMAVIESPSTIYLQPVATPRSAISVIVSAVPVAGPSDRLYMTRSIVAILGRVIPLPQWVRGVSAVANGAFQYRDRAATTLGVALTGAHDRPAIAADIIVTTAGTIVLYY